MNVVYNRDQFARDYVRYRHEETPFCETDITAHQQITQGISGRVFDRVGERRGVRSYISVALEQPRQ